MSFSRHLRGETFLERGSLINNPNPREGALPRKTVTSGLRPGAIQASVRCGLRESGTSVQSFRLTSIMKAKNAEAADCFLSRGSFRFHMVVGKGGFGKVWIVTFRSSKKYFALKEMSKARIIAKKSVHSVMNERQILCSLSHSFIVNIKSSFQDAQHLYLVMDLLTGGDLRFHICYMRRFSEEQTRFFIACLVHALEYVHSQGFLHRDIKPENLVFDEKGYLRLTDFGISRKWSPDNAKETSGTPGYMAPEVMCRMQHNFESDYYAVGVIAFECMTGRRPYDGKSRREIRDLILARQESLKPEDRPKGWSVDSVDFINRLIARKPHKRLGVNGVAEIISHPWFKNFRWDKLKAKELDPPFTPNVREVFDYLRTLSEDSTHNTEAREVDFSSPEVQELFKGYSFENQESKFRSLEREKTERQRSSGLGHKKANSSSSSQILNPIRASQSPKKVQNRPTRNYVSVNLLNIGSGTLSSNPGGSKDFSLLRQTQIRSKSKKENLLQESKLDGGLSNRTYDLTFHSRLRAVSDNIPVRFSNGSGFMKR